ncbi:MAG: ABC transporter permease subunit [Verrucomicrobia bacterium]|nr:ABC transporter permease subunit [Verrucomicrobiota bacterium]
MNWTLLQNSLLVSALATLLAVTLGSASALWIAALDRRWRAGFLGVAAIALALPPFLVTSCWLHLLGHTGILKAWLPVSIYSRWGTIWILALMTWPIALFLVLGAWQKIERGYLESEPGLHGWPMIRWLLLPLARSALGVAGVLIFVLTLNNFAVPAILQTKVFPAELWVSFNTALDYRAALSLCWPLILAPMLLVLWLSRRSIAWPSLDGGTTPDLFRKQLGTAWLWGSGIVSVLLMVMAVGLPIGHLAGVKGTWTELPAALAAGKAALWNSFWLAAVTSVLCVASGLALWRFRSGALFWIPFFVPGVLLGIAMLFLFNRALPLSILSQSAGLVVFGFALRYFAVSWSAAAHAMHSVDSDLTDAAKLNGASAAQILWHVQWPQIAPQIAAAGYVTYLLCLWDVETLVLIVPPGGETLALRVFNLLHYGWNDQVNALCLLLLALAVAPLALWFAGRSRGTSGTRWNASLPALGACCALAGCSPIASNVTPIQSQFFSSVQIIGSRGTAPGQFNKPRSVAVDAEDNLYVVDMTGRVQKFSREGEFLLSWQMPQTDLGKPKGLCRDQAGNIVVIEPHYSRVNHFSVEGKLICQWGNPGTHPGQLMFPRSAIVNSRGEIYVSEYGKVERLQKFTGQGRAFLQSIGEAGSADGQFNRAEGLGIDRHDRLYVADSCNHRIQVFSPAGKFLEAYGRAGDGPGELSYPYDVQVDAVGRQYVCEFGNSRVQIFDEQGRSLELLGGAGSAPGQFANPWGLALDSGGNLYVADSRNHRVQKFIRRKSA